MADMPNLVSATLTDDALAEALRMLDQVEQLLPFLISLDTEARRRMPKMGDSLLGFVNNTLSLVEQRSEFMPGSFKKEEMKKDVALLNKLVTLRTRWTLLDQKLRDTYLVVGSESWKGALAVYNNLMENGGADLEPKKRELAQQFQQAKSEKPAAEVEGE